MGEWARLLQHGLNTFNWVTIAYFFAGNGVYTILMLVSLGSALAYNRRLGLQGLEDLRKSSATPPVTIIIPAFNEVNSVVDTVRSALEADYPDCRVLVVDDGSSDGTVSRLIREFNLTRADVIARRALPASPAHAFYRSPDRPGLLVIAKAHGGKADSLNTGINFCRTPYFCTLDADCLIEPDALLRLIRPIVRAPRETIVSGGIIRIRNGCEVKNGRIDRVRLPRSWIERLQVVEYLRGFLFGRTGWDLLSGTLIVSGAMAVFHRQSVIDAGGFSDETVSEDMELIVRIRRRGGRSPKRPKVSFTLDTVCWTECPSTLRMLARQRRRWQLGLCQTLWLNSPMLFNPRYGSAGMFSYPFHLYVEGLGAAVEFIGYVVVPLAFLFHLALSAFYIPLVALSLVYASFLSVGAVLVEELTYRRYPARRDLLILLGWSVFENFGFRQLILYFRFQGFIRFLTGFREWEKVTHAAPSQSPA